LTAHNLAKRYGRSKLALSGIDITVRSGVITVLVGPNGAGKSTLMKAWVGFERPSQGHVSVAGIDPWVRGGREQALQHVGYVPQQSALYRELRVREHVVLAAALRPAFDPAKAFRRLDDLALDAEQQVGELSGGQRAQVSLALVLAAGGEILILDEPLAALDPLARREFLFLLRAAVNVDGLTAIISSHVVSDIEQAGDDIIVLGSGRKLFEGSIATALATHSTCNRADAGDHDAVSSFLGPAGEVETLIGAGSVCPECRAATLEELVLGYLATSRPSMMERIRSGSVAS
jgi:ABC-2 type transport system ATP-binding protein